MIEYFIVIVGLLSSPTGEYKDHHVQIEKVSKEECIARQGTTIRTFNGDLVTTVRYCEQKENI